MWNIQKKYLYLIFDRVGSAIMITTAGMAPTNLKIAFTKRAQLMNSPVKTSSASVISTAAMVKTTVVITQTKSIAVSFFRTFSLWFVV